MGQQTAAVPYDMFAPVYDRWTAGDHYERWAEFIAARLPALDAPAQVLDLCCGTGRLSLLLRERGCLVTGVDRSPAMLAQAARRLGPDTPLLRADLRQMSLPRSYDAAVCTFDSLNYLVDDGDLESALTATARALRPGGVLVFDVNTRHKLENVFGDSHYGDDLGDFAYVWRNSHDRATRRTTFRITLFQRREDGAFTRQDELHVQRWFTRAEIEAAAAAAGLRVDDVRDDYGDGEPGAGSMRETWVLRRS